MSRPGTVVGDERPRLFLALELPDDVCAALGEWSARCLGGGRRLDTFHVTLAFLGLRPRHELASIVSALRDSVDETAAFELEPLRYRETRSVGMLVLGDESGAATSLATGLQRRLEQLGVYRRETRPWLPHVTVLRFRERPRLAPPLPAVGRFVPSGAAAFLSRLRRSGAHYEVLDSYPFSQ